MNNKLHLMAISGVVHSYVYRGVFAADVGGLTGAAKYDIAWTANMDGATAKISMRENVRPLAMTSVELTSWLTPVSSSCCHDMLALETGCWCN